MAKIPSRSLTMTSHPSWLLCAILLVLLSKTQVTTAEVDEQMSIKNSHAVDKKGQELIPYPRLGRPVDGVQEFLLSLREQSMTANSRNNYEKSQAHKTTKPHKNADVEQQPSSSLIPASEYMLPYLRPGRSQDKQYQISNGNTDDDDDDNDDDESQGQTMIPYPRFGRSEDQGILEPDNDMLFLTPYPRLGKRDSYEESIIPYPRFGKRNTNQESIIPYPRFGKRSSKVSLFWPFYQEDDFSDNAADEYAKMLENYQDGDSDFITPYPRMGKRSVAEYLIPSLQTSGVIKLTSAANIKNPFSALSLRSYILPYSRVGKSLDTLLPHPRFGRQDQDQTMMPTMRFGKSLDDDELLNLLTPYPRFGKRQPRDLIPYPRPGRSENVMTLLTQKDYVRFLNQLLKTNKRMKNGNQEEQSTDLMLPQPRFGRSLEKLRDNKYIPSKKSLSKTEQSIHGGLKRDSKSTKSHLPRTKRSLIDNDKKKLLQQMIQRTRFQKKDSSLKSFLQKENTKSKTKSQFDKYPYDLEEQSYMLPYMRPGRSFHGQFLSVDDFNKKGFLK